MIVLNIGDFFIMPKDLHYMIPVILFASVGLARIVYLYIRSGKSDLLYMCLIITLTYGLVYGFVAKRARESVLVGNGLGAIVIILLVISGFVKVTIKKWE
jgi:hypothetical protein